MEQVQRDPPDVYLLPEAFRETVKESEVQEMLREKLHEHSSTSTPPGACDHRLYVDISETSSARLTVPHGLLSGTVQTVLKETRGRTAIGRLVEN